jgi:hypothetical protein
MNTRAGRGRVVRLREGRYRDKVTRYHSYMAHPAEARGIQGSPNGK